MPKIGQTGESRKEKKGEEKPEGAKPDVRLAYWAHQGDRPAFETPVVRLAHSTGAQGDNVLTTDGPYPMPDHSLPALLVSFWYLKQFMENRHRYAFRDWVMDSGAFSAHNSGAVIDLQEYIDCCKRLMAEDPTLVEIYSLDVIGDWKASLKNTEEMWRQGVPAIPCYHAGEPWDALMGMARDYPKIALGGVALAKSGKKLPWAGQCFARVWPKKIHGFAFGSEKAIMSYPWHSTDSTNWEIGVCKYGQWRAFGGQRISVRGSNQNLRVEVEWYLDLERRARQRWKKEMAKLEEIAPTIRLALGGTGSNTYLKEGGAVHKGLKPDVRLVAANDSGAGGARVISRALGEEADSPGQKLIKQPLRGEAPQQPTVRLALEARKEGQGRANEALERRDSDAKGGK